MLNRIVQILILFVVVGIVNRYLIGKYDNTMLLVVLFRILTRDLHIVTLFEGGLQLFRRL